MKKPWYRWLLAVFCLLFAYGFAMTDGFRALDTDALFSQESVSAGAFVAELTPTPAPVSIFLPPVEAETDDVVDTTFSIEVIATETVKPLGSVLIYHTHTYEAYQQEDTDPYAETETWRTADDAHNVVRIGTELTAMLTSMGVTVVHDESVFELPDLGSAYTRSLEMLTTRLQNGETYDLYIDLHRDAYADPIDNTVTIGGNAVAKILILIGKGEGQTSAGFDELPQWEDNLAIAQFLTDHLNDQCDGLCKDVRLSSSRYNQHVAVGCMLIEVGMNQNTLTQALASVPYLADAIVAYLGTK